MKYCLFLATFLLWTLPAKACEYVEAIMGDYGPGGLVEGTCYFVTAPSEFLLPEDPDGLEHWCITVAMASNNGGSVQVKSAGGEPEPVEGLWVQGGPEATGGWDLVSMSHQGHWAKICSNGKDYFLMGGHFPTVGIYNGPQRTIQPGAVGQPAPEYCEYRVRPADDRGGFFVLSLFFGVCDIVLVLPAAHEVGFREGLYRNKWAGEAWCVNNLFGKVCKIRTQDGRPIDGHAELILDEEGEKVELYFDSATWRTRNHHVELGWANNP